LRIWLESARFLAHQRGRQSLCVPRRARAKGTLVVFICNHCPYVRAVIDRFVEETEALRALGIGVIAVMPNDTTISPGDSFANMKAFAKSTTSPSRM
jgi:hypothetical protein